MLKFFDQIDQNLPLNLCLNFSQIAQYSIGMSRYLASFVCIYQKKAFIKFDCKMLTNIFTKARSQRSAEWLLSCTQSRFWIAGSKIIKAKPIGKSYGSDEAIKCIAKAFSIQIKFDTKVPENPSPFQILSSEINKKFSHQLNLTPDPSGTSGPSFETAIQAIKVLVESEQKVYERIIELLIQTDQSYPIEHQKFLFHAFFYIVSCYYSVIKADPLCFKKSTLKQSSFEALMVKLNQYYPLLEDVPNRVHGGYSSELLSPGRKGNEALGRNFEEVLDLSRLMIVSYVSLVSFSVQTGSVNLNRLYLINQKLVVDRIIHYRMTFQGNQLLSILRFIDLTNLIGHYPNAYPRLLKQILDGIALKGLKFDDFYSYIGFYISLNRLNYSHPKLNQYLKKSLLESRLNNPTSKCTLVKALFEFGVLTPREVQESQILANISQDSQAKYIGKNYSTIVPTLYRISYWQDQKFWLDFFQWLPRAQNYKSIHLLDLISLSEVLQIERDIIPTNVLNEGQKSLKVVSSQLKMDFKNVDYKVLSNKSFKNSTGSKLNISLQSQIANSLRSVSQMSVNVEAQVGIFSVDILINNRVVVEVNNNKHYIYHQCEDGWIKVKDIKSAFRQRILEKMGYHFIEIDLQEYTEGSFKLIHELTRQIRQISEMDARSD